MKKYKILICLFALILIVSGCSKEKEKEKMTGGWETNIDTEMIGGISKNASNAFEKSFKKYRGNKLEPIALLGTQVVAGTKYMFLCKDLDEENWKIVVVSEDLKGNTEISNVKDLDYVNYVSKNIKINNEDTMTGGFIVYDGMGEGVLPDEIDFSKVNNNDDIKYSPIALLGTQVVAGRNYAVLVFEKTKSETYPILSLLTLYNDLDNNLEISYKAQINLADLSD